MTLLASLDVPAPAISDHTLRYLQSIAGVARDKTIQLEYVDSLPNSNVASTSVRYSNVTIRLSNEYAFTAASLQRTILHELLEVAMHDMWEVFRETLADTPLAARSKHEQRMRSARDHFIDSRMIVLEGALFGPGDWPVPKRKSYVYHV